VLPETVTGADAETEIGCVPEDGPADARPVPSSQMPPVKTPTCRLYLIKGCMSFLTFD
jgi:hypothetical protein